MAKKRKNRYTAGNGQGRGLIRLVVKCALGAGVFFLGLMLLSAGLAHSYHALMGSSWFKVQGIEISGVHHLRGAEVLNAMKVPRDASLMGLRMTKLAERVETLPWVNAAVVRVDLSRCLVVEVEEREALGIITGETSHLVDGEGKLFLNVERQEYPELLHLDGFSGLGLKEGEYLPLEPFETLRELKSALERYHVMAEGGRVVEYHWDPVEGISFELLNAKPILIHLGSHAFESKFHRLKRIMLLLEKQEWLEKVRRIDLDYKSRAYVQGNFPRPENS